MSHLLPGLRSPFHRGSSCAPRLLLHTSSEGLPGHTKVARMRPSGAGHAAYYDALTGLHLSSSPGLLLPLLHVHWSQLSLIPSRPLATRRKDGLLTSGRSAANCICRRCSSGPLCRDEDTTLWLQRSTPSSRGELTRMNLSSIRRFPGLTSNYTCFLRNQPKTLPILGNLHQLPLAYAHVQVSTNTSYSSIHLCGTSWNF